MSFTKRGSIGGSGGGGSPSDPDTSVQYNKGGAFAGDADLVFDDTTKTLTPKNISISRAIDLSGKESGMANLTSSGETILEVTDSSVARTVTISTSDVVEGRQFIVKDEGGEASTNTITITTAAIIVDNTFLASPGIIVSCATNHGYITGQQVFHSGFNTSAYNGKFIVTSIQDLTTYIVASITFAGDEDGVSNIAIDGGSSTTIVANYGAMSFYCTNAQIFVIVV